MALRERFAPPAIPSGTLPQSRASAAVLGACSPLLAPMAAAWLINVGFAVLLVSPAFRVYDAGLLPYSAPLRNAAYVLAPNALLSASGGGAAAATVLVYIALASCAVATWCWAMRIARTLDVPTVWPLLGLTALMLTPLLAVPGLQSDDVYLYDLYGRAISVYAANPILHPPSSFGSDPHLPWVHWKDLPSSYGPIWLMLSAVLSGIAQHSITAVVAVYRIAGTVLHLATAAAIWHVLRRGPRRTAVAGTLFYAWNPLVLQEVVANAHNDVLVALLAVLLVAAAMRRAWMSAAFFGACAVMVKPFAVLLLPGLAGQIVRESREGFPLRLLAAASAVVASTIVAVSLPLWSGAGLLTNVLNNPAATMYTNSVWELIADAGTALSGVGRFTFEHPYIDVLRGGLFIAGALWVLTRRAASRRAVPQAALRLWLVFCLTACWVWPWYFVPALALAPIAGRASLPAAAGLTIGGLLFWAAWPEPRPWPLDWLYTWRSLVLFGPLLLIATWAPARTAARAGLGLGRRQPRRGAGDGVDAQPAAAAG